MAFMGYYCTPCVVGSTDTISGFFELQDGSTVFTIQISIVLVVIEKSVG